MPIEGPTSAVEIILLERNNDEAALIGETVQNSRVTVVNDCPEILAFLRREGKYVNAARPALILLDLVLSKTGHCEVLTQIKKDPQFKRIPVLVLASSGSSEDIFEAYDTHANAFICKPASREEFRRVLRATLHFWLTLVRLPID